MNMSNSFLSTVKNFSRGNKMNEVKVSYKFTIIELMIVIVIIFILAALLLPILVGVKEKTKRVLCLNNTRQLVTATIIYSKNSNAKLPIENRNRRLIAPQIFRGDMYSELAVEEDIWKCPSNNFFSYQTDRSHGSMRDFGIPNILPSYFYLGVTLGHTDSYIANPDTVSKSLYDDEPYQRRLFSDIIQREVFGSDPITNNHNKNDPFIIKGSVQSYLDGHSVWNEDIAEDMAAPRSGYHYRHWQTSWWW